MQRESRNTNSFVGKIQFFDFFFLHFIPVVLKLLYNVVIAMMKDKIKIARSIENFTLYRKLQLASPKSIGMVSFIRTKAKNTDFFVLSVMLSFLSLKFLFIEAPLIKKVDTQKDREFHALQKYIFFVFFHKAFIVRKIVKSSKKAGKKFNLWESISNLIIFQWIFYLIKSI